MKKYSGFTLIELMITVSIAGIAMAFAMPALESYIQNDRLTTQINTFVGHLSLARSEAVTRKQQVIVCISSTSTNCTGTNWNEGWIVFADTDGDSAFTAGEPIIRAQQALEGNNTLTSSASITGGSIIYDYRGFAATNSGSTGTFSLCDSRGSAHVKSISISNTGRVRKGGSTAC